MSRFALRCLRTLLPVLLGAVCAGCSGNHRNEDFIPPEQNARQAVERHLSAWQRGEPGITVSGANPVVQAGDLLRQSGRKLEGFEILGTVPTEAPRCFAVRLRLADPPEERRERYVVVGIDPLWVFRFDDYAMLMHWDHPMPAAPPNPGVARPTQK